MSTEPQQSAMCSHFLITPRDGYSITCLSSLFLWHSSSRKEIFPNVKLQSLLVQFEAISSSPVAVQPCSKTSISTFKSGQGCELKQKQSM